jgi:hypothetical protein
MSKTELREDPEVCESGILGSGRGRGRTPEMSGNLGMPADERE